jgi:TPR repeat protein
MMKRLTGPGISAAASAAQHYAPSVLLSFGLAILLFCACSTVTMSPQEMQDFNQKHVADILLRARTGDVNAQLSASLIYSSGTYGEPQNNAEALKWLRTAADSGNLTARMRLAAAYRVGTLGLQKDTAEAIARYRAIMTGPADPKAASVARGNAANVLGDIYERDLGGGAENIAQALQFYEIAVADKIMSAAMRLATLYERGLGVPRSLADAYKWQRINESYIGQNVAFHQMELKRLAGAMSPEEVSRAETAAREWIAAHR